MIEVDMECCGGGPHHGHADYCDTGALVGRAAELRARIAELERQRGVAREWAARLMVGPVESVVEGRRYCLVCGRLPAAALFRDQPAAMHHSVGCLRVRYEESLK